MNCRTKLIQGLYLFVVVALVTFLFSFAVSAPAQLAQKEKDETAIRGLVDKINQAWKLEKPSTLFQEILSDKGFVAAIPKPKNPSEAAIINKQRFCEFIDNKMQGQQRPQKHEHEVESITIIGPLAYEIGITLEVLADGTQRYDKVMNFYAKDETGWRLIFSAPVDNVGKALSSNPVDISCTQNLSSEQKRRI